MTAHHLKQDVRNPYGHGYALLHRSADGGMTWRTVPIPNTEVPGAPSDDWVVTSRNVLERPDGSLWLGVSASRGRDFLWRSLDRGATWDRTRQSQCAGVDPTLLWWPFWAETVLWQTRAGDALGLWRVDPRVVPRLPGSDVPDYTGDNVERLVVYRARDDGRRWTREPELGSWYGEMYPALLRLRDGRLLCTFTVRALGRPLGVQAVLGDELPDGFRFDFAYDRLILDIRTPTNASSSGGGFGPTVQPDDATLVTAYSWRDAEDQTHLEAVRWPVPE